MTGEVFEFRHYVRLGVGLEAVHIESDNATVSYDRKSEVATCYVLY
jgi:hypothetical protein